MEAGSDTTASTLLNFVLALTKNPHVLKKAQGELDALCGTERSPTTDDFGRLPYVAACMAEVRGLSCSFR
jgi:cytochrome P450